MDFERILSEYRSKACIISVEKYPDVGYGNIRIAAGNKAHCDDMLNVMGRPFIPNLPYEEYLPKNQNFEDYCYRCAILGQPMHSYVPLPQMQLWLNMFLLPLTSDQENIGYCIYTYDVTPEADSEKMANVSAEAATTVLRTCIKLRGSVNLRQTFGEVVDDIRQICDSDHCCILLTNHEERTCLNLCESIKPGCGLLPMDTYLDEGFYNITKTWEQTIGDSTCIIIKDARDMDWLKTVNPVWHKSLTDAGAESIVMFPLKHNGNTLGYVWAINFNVENTVRIKETLELTTFFIASEIANYQLMQRLEILSSMDMLTGVMNRNQMNTVVDEILNGRVSMQLPYAVVFADLNGLKHVNDEDGHDAGDQILKKAAAILREAFPECDVFRAGGDEFMVIARGMDENEVEEKRRFIKERAEAIKDLCFAIGTHVVRSAEDIRTAMRLADQGMYADKREYYASHPDRRYR